MFDYVILHFDDKNRIGDSGIQATSLSTHSRLTIHMKKKTIDKAEFQPYFAKVDISGTPVLVEILGRAGEYESELQVYQLLYGIRPCKYPLSYNLVNGQQRVSLDTVRVVSVDDLGTKDIDDALSCCAWIDIPPDMAALYSNQSAVEYVLGIHITDVASRIPTDSPLIEWAANRASSAYHALSDGSTSSFPMFPPNLAHSEFSLVEGQRRNAISLFLAVARGCIVHEFHACTSIVNASATTYARFQPDEPSIYRSFEAISGMSDPRKIVEWAMIRYNSYFGRQLRNRRGLLRVQPTLESAALYCLPSADGCFRHESLDISDYAHCSSPIRRFADLFNQYALTGVHLSDVDVDRLNDRMSKVSAYHSRVNLSCLAYSTRLCAITCDCIVQKNVDDDSMLHVFIDGRRYRLPLRDSYYSEPLRLCCDANLVQKAELFGIFKGGLMQLRIRPVSVPDPQDQFDEHFYARCLRLKLPCARELAAAGLPLEFLSNQTHCDIANMLGVSDQQARTLKSALADWIARQPRIVMTDNLLTQSDMESTLSFGLDSFQLNALAQIQSKDADVLAMAPTGSGKTVLALMAVLQAFKRGYSAAYTSPIKALSNQKFGEFKQWFQNHVPDAGVSLLTGDIRIKASENKKYHLLICTSEILRNKLVAKGGEPDEDLQNVGSVVSDEIHYINDAERGSVWEETVIHLPRHMQFVALSATLKNPEKFAEWIQSSRSRRCSLVRRFDRHVPLHVGSMHSSEFFEILSTHGPRRHTFDRAAYTRVAKIRAEPRALSDDAVAAKQERRAEKQKLHRKPEDAFVSTKTEMQPHASLASKIIDLTTQLQSLDLFPTLVFVFSRKRCVQSAEAIQSCNLLGDDANRTRTSIHALTRAYLRTHLAQLEILPAYHELMNLMFRGIGFHHSGMLPILREFVEICFQHKLLRIIFATETLAVGVNMPARSVVFTQVSKPTAGRQSRHLRPDEFWQMAGRAGRRGMDDKGHVLYSPIFEEQLAAQELEHIMCSDVPPASSQLTIDKFFVLRHLNTGMTRNVIEKTLLFDQTARRLLAMRAERETYATPTEDELQYYHLQKQLKCTTLGGARVVLNAKQKRQIESKLQLLRGKGEMPLDMDRVDAALTLDANIKAHSIQLDTMWNDATQWLEQYGFVEAASLTPRGRACVCFSDGNPLIMGTIVSDGWLNNLEFEDICAWLSLFFDDCTVSDPDPTTSHCNEKLTNVIAETRELARILDVRLNLNLGFVVHDWCQTKSIANVLKFVDGNSLGTFVKAILRIGSHIDAVREALMGLAYYEAHAKLDNHMHRLLGGMVTNQSLYVFF